MTSRELLDSFLASSKQDTDALLATVRPIDEAALNKQPQPGVWSPAQILDHLTIANRIYLPHLDAVIANAKKGEEEVQHSLAGKMIISAMNANKAPAPKQLIPRAADLPIAIIDEWLGVQKELEERAKQSFGLMLSSYRFRNPFIRIVKMNGADAYRILEVHLKYHLAQIAERSK